jgi:DNA-binding transcriptional regulator LsrR (DeoR family)
VAHDRGNRNSVDDAELATRAAWLYYEASLTQAEISAQLRVPPAKVQRLIARAMRDGLVRILIEGDMAGCIKLERALMTAHRLNFCRVVPSIPGVQPFSGLGRAAASYLYGAIETGAHRIIGVGHGRSLAAMVDHLPHVDRPDLTLVSVIGGVPRRVGTNPFDVVHALAEKTNAAAWVMPVPFYANDAEDRVVLLRQRGVTDTLALAAEASLFVMGIGEVTESAFLCQSGMMLPSEIAEARNLGAVGEAFGTFYNAAGQRIATSLHDRVIAVDIEAMRNREVLMVAGGIEKLSALRAIFNTNLPTAFITDETTARALIANAS